MIKKEDKTEKKALNPKKKLSVHELIRKDKYIPQFKSLIEETNCVKFSEYPFATSIHIN